MAEELILCRNGGLNKDYFDSREALLEELTELIETAFSIDEVGIFIDGVSYKLHIRPSITKGWTPCDDCRCCLQGDLE